MNKVLASLFVALFLTAASAQAHCGSCGVGDAPKAEGASKADDMGAMVSAKVEKLTKELSLNDEQKGKVEAIIKEKMEKKHQIMEEKHKAMDALHEEFKTKLSGVLTPEQVTKWESMKKDFDGCPMCKDGKMCKKCKLMKGKKDSGDHEDHEGHEGEEK